MIYQPFRLIIHCTVFILLLGFVYQPIRAQIAWENLASMPTDGRWGAVSFAVNGKVYVGMGYDGISNQGDLWEYDHQTNSWNQKASYAISRRAAATFVLNGKAYVCGGLGGSGGTLLNDLIEYNPVTNTWAEKNSLPEDGLYGAAGFAIGNKGYICCGNLGNADGPYSKRLWEYNPENNSWIQKVDFPGNARYGMSYSRFVIGKKAYTGMGYSGNGSAFYNDMYCYDQDANSWTPISYYPGAGRAYLTGFTLCDGGYLGTGQINGSAKSDLWQYSPSNDSWKKMSDFPGGDRWVMAVGELSNTNVYLGTGDNFSTKFNDWWEVSCNDVGFEELSYPQARMRMFPNPLVHTTVLEFDEPLEATVSVVNVEGRVVKQLLISGQSIQLNRDNLPAGLYHIVIRPVNRMIITVKLAVMD